MVPVPGSRFGFKVQGLWFFLLTSGFSLLISR